MPRAKATKLYRTFTKGLITEAGYLTYPEDASIDELNTVISRKGNRTRRLGIDYQTGYVIENLSLDNNKVIGEHAWLSVNNDSSVAFVCVQVGRMIYFYSLSGASPVSASKKTFSIDLDSYKIPGTSILDLSKVSVEFSSGFGLLFIVHPLIDPISVEYQLETDTLEIVRIVIQIRDLEGVYDGLSNDEEPTTLTKEHQYNLQNQGWLTPGTKTLTPGFGDGSDSIGGGTSGGTDQGTFYDPYTGTERPSTGGGGSSSLFNVSYQ